MKKIFSVFIVFFLAFMLSSCDFGDHHTTNPDEYDPKDGNITITYFPKSIDEYSVNSYSYNTYRFFDTCTEIFLDITATKEQFDHIIDSAKKFDDISSINQAYYDPNYTEIIFSDYYSGSDEDTEENTNVGNADIKKIIYNEKTLNIVFEYFYAIDSEVYPLDKVAYFNHFNISEKDYILHSESYWIEDDTQNETGSGFSFI